MFLCRHLLPDWKADCPLWLWLKVTKYLILCLTTILTVLMPIQANAKVYPIPPNGARLIGSQEIYKVKPGDYFHSIAKFYHIGLIALMESNPDIDPFLPPPGIELKIPSRMLLPDALYQGIVINLPELRLYYFEKGTNKVHVFPVGIGRIDRPTPVMRSKIMSRIKDPTWTPNTKSRASYFAKHGKELATIVLAGKDNPLGDYALQLEFGRNNYLIHGTNQNFGIGMRISAGCIRMTPEDIAWLFSQVAINDPVRIINQPIKVSTEPNGENILEVHSPLTTVEGEKKYNLNRHTDTVKFNNSKIVDIYAVKKTLLLQQGLPVNVNF
jgi:lipoprotein-anchoring transpeptidase ErfK/SrfK